MMLVLKTTLTTVIKIYQQMQLFCYVFDIGRGCKLINVNKAPQQCYWLVADKDEELLFC